MTELRTRLISLLIDLEYEMRIAKLWGHTPPTAEALGSTEPFCVDTMPFPQWLQYVFIPRMHMMLTDTTPIPERCEISTMAETTWPDNPLVQPVIKVLRTFDEQINQSR
jgi:uncharacterized protein YqcC (DUF446 family)